MLVQKKTSSVGKREKACAKYVNLKSWPSYGQVANKISSDAVCTHRQPNFPP